MQETGVNCYDRSRQNGESDLNCRKNNCIHNNDDNSTNNSNNV